MVNLFPLAPFHLFFFGLERDFWRKFVTVQGHIGFQAMKQEDRRQALVPIPSNFGRGLRPSFAVSKKSKGDHDEKELASPAVVRSVSRLAVLGHMYKRLQGNAWFVPRWELQNVVTEEDGPERKAQVDALTREGGLDTQRGAKAPAAGAARRQGADGRGRRRQGAAAGAARRQGAAAGAAAPRRGGRGSVAPNASGMGGAAVATE
eukprot:jgi/Tetstr1/462564/TSEL_000681.t1